MTGQEKPPMSEKFDRLPVWLRIVIVLGVFGVGAVAFHVLRTYTGFPP